VQACLSLIWNFYLVTVNVWLSFKKLILFWKDLCETLKTFWVLYLWVHVVFMNFNIKFESLWQYVRICESILKWVWNCIFFNIGLRIELEHIFRREFYFLKTTSWTSTWFPWLNFVIRIGKVLKLWLDEKQILRIFLVSIFVLIIGYVDFVIIVILVSKLKWLLNILLILKFFDDLLKIKSFF
jgi:hypothetical protein